MPSPLDLADLPFLRDALLELVLLGIAGGILGAWIVLRRLAFFSHAVGSATFPGLVAADASGVSPTLAGIAVALGYAGGVERAGRAGREPSEATALLLVACLAGGVILASNHISHADPLTLADAVMFSTKRMPKFLAKASLVVRHLRLACSARRSVRPGMVRGPCTAGLPHGSLGSRRYLAKAIGPAPPSHGRRPRCQTAHATRVGCSAYGTRPASQGMRARPS